MSGDEWLDSAAGLDAIRVDLPAVRAEIDRLALLDRLEYETMRKDAARRLGISVGFLDREIERRRGEAAAKDETDAPADAQPIETLEPWDKPVDGAALAAEMRARLAAHVAYSKATDPDALVLWLLGSACMDAWSLFPKVVVTSPTPQCGKSRLMTALDALALRGLLLSNGTAAFLFRAIQLWKPTMLLDEADLWAKEDPAVASILNSGHDRRAARVGRTIEANGSTQPGMFSTWAPMAIAGIGALRESTMSRAVVIELRRRLPSEPVERMPADLHARCLGLRRRLMRWASDNAARLAGMESEPADCGDDRRRDNWTPLHRVAQALGDDWPVRCAAAYAAATRPELDEEQGSAGVMLLADLIDVFAGQREEKLKTDVILSELHRLDSRPWAEFNRGRPLSSHGLAKLLAPFGIRPRVFRLSGETPRGYFRSDVADAFSRYAPDVADFKPQHRNIIDSKKKNEEADRNGATSADPPKEEISQSYQSCCGVADCDPQHAPSVEKRSTEEDRDPELWR